MTRAALAGAAALLAVSTPLAAQQAVLRVGGVRATYADTLTGSAGTLGGTLGWTAPRSRGTLGTSLARFTSGAWAVQGSGTALALVVGGAGLFADGAGNTIEGGTWSGTGTLGLFVAAPRGALLLSASAGGGGLRRIDGTTDALATGTGRLRLNRARWEIEASLTATRVGSQAFADATLGAVVSAAALRLGAAAGGRGGDLAHEAWVQTSAELRVSPIAALEVAAGSYPRDLTGFVGGVYFAAGVRLEIRRAPSPVVGARAGRRAAPAVALERLGAGRVRVVVLVPEARALAIAGEWNGWALQPLERVADGRWSVVLPLAPGTYRFALVADGGRWFVPPGVPTLPDEFGGSAGLLLVGS